MKIEIDQSGKVEATAVKTVVCDSLGNCIVVSSEDKKTIQELYRIAGRPKMFVYELFSLLCALVIKLSYSRAHTYRIDVEYFGQEDLLTRLILQNLQKMKIYISSGQINFHRIGKKSKAHSYAYEVYKQLTKGQKIRLTTILRYILQ